jgi:hypothetical protein
MTVKYIYQSHKISNYMIYIIFNLDGHHSDASYLLIDLLIIKKQ